MFNEKAKEMGLPVWKTPKYEAAKKKALEIIESGKYDLNEADFWILMNQTKNRDKMQYTGLIISHNGCLKINDKLESKFDPECVTCDKEGYKGSLVFSYCNKEQGLYEVGEVSPTNCKNEYPYAMAYKRLFDRVVLKLSRLAYAGIYSDAEADEFAQQLDAATASDQDLMDLVAMQDQIAELCGGITKANKGCMAKYGKKLYDLNEAEMHEVLGLLQKGA